MIRVSIWWFLIFILSARGFVDRVLVVYVLLRSLRLFIDEFGPNEQSANLFLEHSNNLTLSLFLTLFLGSVTYYSYQFSDEKLKKINFYNVKAKANELKVIRERCFIVRDAFFCTAAMSYIGLYFFDKNALFILLPFLPICLFFVSTRKYLKFGGQNLQNIFLFFYFLAWAYSIYLSSNVLTIENIFAVVFCGRLFFSKFSDWIRVASRVDDIEKKHLN